MAERDKHRPWMNKKKTGFLLFGIIMIFLVFYCKKSDVVDPAGTYLGRSECDNVFESAASNRSIQGLQNSPNEIVQYIYQNRVLTINHINAGFNCCPEIACEITLEGKNIVIEETELKAGCHCLCLFTLKYEVKNLVPGVYKIILRSPYIPVNGAPVEFELELYQDGEGSLEFVRDVYPWI